MQQEEGAYLKGAQGAQGALHRMAYTGSPERVPFSAFRYMKG